MTQQSKNRLDRIERILLQIVEQQALNAEQQARFAENIDQRIDSTRKLIGDLAKITEKGLEKINENAKQIGDLTRLLERNAEQANKRLQRIEETVAGNN